MSIMRLQNTFLERPTMREQLTDYWQRAYNELPAETRAVRCFRLWEETAAALRELRAERAVLRGVLIAIQQGYIDDVPQAIDIALKRTEEVVT